MIVDRQTSDFHHQKDQTGFMVILIKITEAL